MKYIYRKLLILVMILLPLTAFAQSVNYVIRGRDVLAITVYDHPDLNTKVRVSESETITFPLLGEVSVKGLTAVGMEKKLAELLSKGMIVNPQVSVFVEQFKTKKVVLMGEVNKPGKYEWVMDEPTYVADALSNGLGLTKDAGEFLTILRKHEKKQEKLVINLEQLLKKGDMSQNAELQDSDLLYVQRAGYYYIYGEANRPGFYRIEPEMTLIKAMSTAGGPTQLAATEGIRVIRKENGKEKTIRVKLNNPLQQNDEFFADADMSQDIQILDGDVIYLPRSEYFYIYGEVNRPGHYKIEPDLTVIKAISIAGGVNNKASTDRIKITRKTDKKETSLDARLDTVIQGDDVIIVPESFF
ncbi:MAG: SLBB domain-containing protein [Candidatus Schekmanbacteria bacterium]|nr:SLBB domain-containing protein [Candidatus Schekmanbacteria bacterium]